MRFSLEKFSDYPTVKKSILDANAMSDVLLLDLDETLVSHKSFVYNRILRYFETLPDFEWNPELSEKLINRIEFEGTDGVLDFVIDQFYKSAKIEFFCASIASKPSPLCLIHALGGTPPDHALFIGDSEVDSLAAEGAGVKFINVSNLLVST